MTCVWPSCGGPTLLRRLGARSASTFGANVSHIETQHARNAEDTQYACRESPRGAANTGRLIGASA
jgi:hypothetical protein